jgi:hypothetical protein
MSRRTVLLVFSLMLLVAILVVFLIPFATRETLVDALMVNGRPECPQHDKIFVDSSGTWVPRPVEIAGSGPITYVPEYHDCQRFMVQASAPKKYGPLVAIFARIDLAALGDPPGLLTSTGATGLTGTAVPIAGVTSTAAPSLGNLSLQLTNLALVSTGTQRGTERSVATILNYDDAYDPLHIPRGYSCLYVFHETTTTWAARLVQAPSDATCLEPMDTVTKTFWRLGVTHYDDPGPPPVARWDWDSGTQEQYVGIRCGSRWCEVYNPDKAHTPSPTYLGRSKGSYDEQVLAEATTGVGNPDGLIPGEAIGTAFPVGVLEQNTEIMFKNAWVPVAQVSLSQESPVYKSKYKLSKRPGEEAPNGKNWVSLCMGTKSQCVPLTAQAGVGNCGNATDPWWARIENSEGKKKYRCVVRRLSPTGAPLPPGVVRWRWKLQDEGMWIRCPGGCCEKT